MQRQVFPNGEQIAGSRHLLSETYTRAEKELTQVKRHYGRRNQKSACAVGAVVYFYGTIDPNHPNSLRVDLLPPHVKMIWKGFVEYLKKQYGSDVVRLNDNRGWTFERFKEEAIKWESMTFPDSFT